MNTELPTPTLTKKVKITVDQYATIRTALSQFIKESEKRKLFFIDELNASNSTDEVKEKQRFVKMAKDQIKEAEESIKILDASDTIREYKFDNR